MNCRNAGKWAIKQQLISCPRNSAVNEAERIEKLCEPLNRRILTSATFAEASGEAGEILEPVGAFELRGVTGLQVIYGTRAETTQTRPYDGDTPAGAKI